MFDLKRPCIDCPFRKGVGERFQLPPLRLREIKHAVAFQCHRTVDYENFDDDEKRQGKKPQQCAGLMAVLIREDCPNSIMQVAERFGRDLSGIDPEREAYESWNEVLKAHCPEETSHETRSSDSDPVRAGGMRPSKHHRHSGW